MLELFDEEDEEISQEEYLMDMTMERDLANESARTFRWDEFDKDGNNFIDGATEFPRDIKKAALL